MVQADLVTARIYRIAAALVTGQVGAMDQAQAKHGAEMIVGAPETAPKIVFQIVGIGADHRTKANQAVGAEPTDERQAHRT